MAVSVATRIWTLEELHSLPDDGNKYELVRGELFVTPPPGDEHETILARLTDILAPYVREHRLGMVFHPKSVMRFDGSQVEPDLMVRAPHPDRRGNDTDWDRAPIPILVVEVLSGATRQRDLNQKKWLYVDAGVMEYWVIHPEARTLTIVVGDSMHAERERVTWSPARAAVPLAFNLAEIFD